MTTQHERPMTHPTLARMQAIAEKLGSAATTSKGIAKFLRGKKLTSNITPNINTTIHHLIDHAKVGDTIILRDGVRTGYRWKRFTDSGAQRRAAESIGTLGHRSNYGNGGPKVYGEAHQARSEAIHYKGHYKGYTGSHLYWDYQSAIGISPSGNSAVIITECKLIRRIGAPSGLKFDRDDNGILLRRRSDGMDYHPTDEDWRAKDFATRVRAAMSENYKKRQAAKRELAAQQKFEKTFLRDVRTTLVTLNDSRAAGNCVEGSLQFAERKLHIPREEILAGGHLFTVPAVKLMEAGKGEPRVEQAVRKAWMRETTISI